MVILWLKLMVVFFIAGIVAGVWTSLSEASEAKITGVQQFTTTKCFIYGQIIMLGIGCLAGFIMLCNWILTL